jgi:hypothetical protein
VEIGRKPGIQPRKNKCRCFLILFCVVSSVNAKFWVGADAGINSPLGFINAITFVQERMYTLIHLDTKIGTENSGAGYVGLAYRIPAQVGFVPVGVALVVGGSLNQGRMAFGFYSGFQKNLTENTLVYSDISFVPEKFQGRKFQFFSIDAGLSIALFSIWKKL